jgi:hypothetical protein
MSAPCAHFRHLEQRSIELVHKFLESEISAEAADPLTFTADLDRLAAFRLLFHAEVETFLEEKAKEGLSKLQTDLGVGVWGRGNPNALALYLLCGPYIFKPSEIDSASLSMHFEGVVKSARDAVAENNGIKEKSFTVLAIAAGKVIEEIDSTLVSTLSSYGKDRGEVAHGSAARARTLMAPSAEKAAAVTIVAGLSAFYDVIS